MLVELISELNTRDADFIKIVDISMLSVNQNRGYSIAILIGIALNPSYIFRMSKKNILDKSEFSEKENSADKLAEWTADFINDKGYKAFAQSERNLCLHGFYDEMTKRPHFHIKQLP